MSYLPFAHNSLPIYQHESRHLWLQEAIYKLLQQQSQLLRLAFRELNRGRDGSANFSFPSAFFAGFTGLRALELFGCVLAAEQLHEIAGLTNLRELKTKEVTFLSPPLSEHLSTLVNLTCLQLLDFDFFVSDEDSHNWDTDLCHVSSLQALQRLDVTCPYGIEVAAWTTLTSMTHLYLDKYLQMDASTMCDVVQRMPWLVDLRIPSATLTDDLAEVLSTLTQLTNLEVATWGVPQDCSIVLPSIQAVQICGTDALSLQAYGPNVPPKPLIELVPNLSFLAIKAPELSVGRRAWLRGKQPIPLKSLELLPSHVTARVIAATSAVTSLTLDGPLSEWAAKLKASQPCTMVGVTNKKVDLWASLDDCDTLLRPWSGVVSLTLSGTLYGSAHMPMQRYLARVLCCFDHSRLENVVLGKSGLGCQMAVWNSTVSAIRRMPVVRRVVLIGFKKMKAAAVYGIAQHGPVEVVEVVGCDGWNQPACEKIVQQCALKKPWLQVVCKSDL